MPRDGNNLGDDFDEVTGLIVPTVVEDGPKGRVSYDIYSRLLKDRIIRLTGPINDEKADLVTSQMLYLASIDKSKDITLYIDSPGGVITAGMSIYDIMQNIPCDVATVCVGQAASMGAVIFAGGAEGKRSILPNATFMVHEGSGGYEGKAGESEQHTAELRRKSNICVAALHADTGQPKALLDVLMKDDVFLTAEQTVEFGAADKVVYPAKQKNVTPKTGWQRPELTPRAELAPLPSR